MYKFETVKCGWRYGRICGFVHLSPLSGSIILNTTSQVPWVPYTLLSIKLLNLTDLFPLRLSSNDFANHTLQSRVKTCLKLVCEPHIEEGMASKSECCF